MMHTIKNSLRTFRTSRSGMAAIEFAVVAPVLLLMLGGAVEMSRAHVIKGNLNALAYSVGQVFVALDSTVSVNKADLIWNKVTREIMAPQPVTGLRGNVAQVTRVGSNYHVDWLTSAPEGGTAVNYGDVVKGLANGKSAIVVDLSYKLQGGLFGDWLNQATVHSRLVHFQINPL